MVQIFMLLSNKSASRVIEFFLRRPTAEAYAEKLRQEIKISRKSLLDSLAKLEGEGLLVAKRIGRVKAYSLNRGRPLVKQLKTLATVSELLPELEGLAGEAEVYLFGSAARGEDTETSDVDLLVIGRVERSKVARILGGAMRERIKPVVMTALEYSRLSRTDPAFYERIEKDKIRLV
ncbi:MAG: nucleotidyltransferase domain-containing protein [Candidatus Micrarchaeota archaeon]